MADCGGDEEAVEEEEEVGGEVVEGGEELLEGFLGEEAAVGAVGFVGHFLLDIWRWVGKSWRAGVVFDRGFYSWCLEILEADGGLNRRVWLRAEVCFSIEDYADDDGNLSLSSPLSILRTMELCHRPATTVDYNRLCES